MDEGRRPVTWGPPFLEDTSHKIILTTPIFLPIITSIGVDPIAYGIVLMFCICIGGVTPPLAVCLFTSCRILKLRIEETIPDVFIVIGILFLVTVILMIFPQTSLWLPMRG